MPLATEILGFAPVFSDYRTTWDLQKKYLHGTVKKSSLGFPKDIYAGAAS